MQLKEINGKTKKGNTWTGYVVQIGDFTTPLFFPSKIEADYIKRFLRKQAHDDFGDLEDFENVDSD